MTKILIPRSDSISAKIIEPSDFEKFYTDDIIPDYKYSGFTLTAGSGLAVNVSSGVVRLKGLYLESSASETVSSLTASDVNYIYVKLARDSASEAESWDFFKNLTGTTPTDAFFIGTATTNGSAVTAVDQTTVIDIAIPKFEHMYYGDGSDGDVTISSNTNLSEVKRYNNLTINSGQTLSMSAGSHSSLIIQVKDTLTINGTISMDGKGAAGSDGGAVGGGGAAGTGNGGQGSPGTDGKIAAFNGNFGSKDTTNQGIGNSSGSGQGGTASETTVDAVTGLNYRQGVKTATPNTRTGIPFYIATTMPQMYGAGGSGGSGGGGGDGGDVPVGGYGSAGIGGYGGLGGVGGSGGGGIILMAKTIVFNSGAVITADGANGATGVVSGNPTQGYSHNPYGHHGHSGGGGGGGEGGQVILLYNYLTNSGTFTVTGGSAGAGGASNSNSGQGTSVAGSAGGAGQAGATKLVQLG
jgi:hypothetical protein